MKEINGFNDAMNFWRMLFKAPIRAIAVAAVLVILWFDNGWIFHPIHSTISVVVTVLIMFAVTVCLARLGIFDNLNWRSSLIQKVASKCSIAFLVLVAIYKVFGNRHAILFTILSVVILLIALKDVILEFLRK